MIYHLAVFDQQAPQAPFVAIQSPTPFHSIAAGRKIRLPQGLFVVVDVTHEFGKNPAGGDHTTMQVLVSH